MSMEFVERSVPDTIIITQYILLKLVVLSPHFNLSLRFT